MTVISALRVVSAGLALGGVVATLAGCGTERTVAVAGVPSAAAPSPGKYVVKAETLSPTHPQFAPPTPVRPPASAGPPEPCPRAP